MVPIFELLDKPFPDDFSKAMLYSPTYGAITPTTNPGMPLGRPRMLTLAFDDKETVMRLPNTFAELVAFAREWVKPLPDARISFRIPVDYAAIQAARFVHGPYLWIDSEDSYAISTNGVQGTRVEIVSDAPPPVDSPPPYDELSCCLFLYAHRAKHRPPPVLSMDGSFELELEKGKSAGIDVTITSDDLDMAHTEDGAIVDGAYWGKLDVVHDRDRDVHKMEFSGTRLQNQNISPNMLVDQRVISKLAIAAKPTFAKCSFFVLWPQREDCVITLSFSPYWKIGCMWPPADSVSDDRGKSIAKYIVRVNPGGALEHFQSLTVVTSIYYEAIPDQLLVDASLVSPQNSFAMPSHNFVSFLPRILELFGLTIQQRTNFIINNLVAFRAHTHIAFRFMPPIKLGDAFDIFVTRDDCIWTRVFLIFRGLTEADMPVFAMAGEKEASLINWREVIQWREESKDTLRFRMLELSAWDCT